MSTLASFCLYIVAMSIFSIVVNVAEVSDDDPMEDLGERWYSFLLGIYAAIVSSLNLNTFVVCLLCFRVMHVPLQDHWVKLVDEFEFKRI